MALTSNLPLDVAGALSVWLETLLYGIYTCLFFSSVYVTMRKRMIKTRPAKIFFFTTIFMYLIATVHIAINLYRLLRAYVYLRDIVGPENYWLDLGTWDNLAHDAFNAMMTWTGDGLVIYRCYLVWDNNFSIVLIPAALLVVSIVSNSIALHLFTKVPLGGIFSPTLVHWMNTIYAVAFVQNALTTSLIAYRIWKQEYDARRAGLRDGNNSRSSLIPIVRIIVESAMLYMAELLCLIVLYALDHNGQYIIQEMSVPSIGIVLNLISIRLTLRSHQLMKTTTMRSSEAMRLEWRVATTQNTNTMETITNTDSGIGNSTFRGVHVDLEKRDESNSEK